jgi:hypothetical protein
LLLLIAGVAKSLVVGYHVEPRSAGQSGWTQPREPGNHTVSQVVTVNFDELDSAAGGCYVELFVGAKCTSQQYYLTILTYPGHAPIGDAFGDRADVDHEWVRFYLKNPVHPESIVRGKKLEFRDFGDTILNCP